ncbi:MAG: guanitoxin biosynthesis MATE family efflux transporter GntT [Nostoc sp. CmiVER01]|uniref:guanitoxin biosynthesis MATE family efflux transporter GntT n=1 Tax=Nostoc sp. CmiVER01 TaxID=3075384 RepID=UPI002AD396F7|nr:guanitoxin biosynthesis MATE family efflux transporter GntT [Nostoc sp. CmiVER01]MDZ8121964.1 guanitoxin biosynthesis MATE family efflux transporter GntT [Nostoc sp. CmiVER01]
MSSFAQRSVFIRHFLKLASVNVLSNLMVPLAGLIDVMFLGHLTEIRHLAGVALATILFNYIYWTFGFLRMGTTGMVAQAIGRKDNQSAVLIGLQHGILALILGLAILIFQQPLQILGFAILSATPEVKSSGVDFYNALVWGAPATLINFVLIGWFLGQAQSSKVLLLSAISNFTNVLLDYLFIVQWGWASKGAGLATATSQYLMLIVGILLYCQTISFKQIQALIRELFNLSVLKSALMLNGEIIIRTFALISTMAMFSNLSSMLGTEILAANTLLIQVVSLAAYFIDGLAFATESLAGIFQGSGNITSLKKLLQTSVVSSLVIGLMFATAFILAPESLLRLLTNHTEIINHLRSYIPWLLPVLGFGSVAYALDGYFLGLTQGHILRQAMLTATVIGFIPSAITAWYFHNSHLLWLSMSLFMAARTITLALCVPKTFSKRQ